MSAKDFFHEVVRKALQKEDWKITHDPFQLTVGDVEMLIDLGAEQLIAAEREDCIIAVEIKNLAVPLTAYQTFFKRDFPRMMIEENRVKLVIYDAENEVIAEWKN
jgi:hypothetical protein